LIFFNKLHPKHVNAICGQGAEFVTSNSCVRKGTAKLSTDKESFFLYRRTHISQGKLVNHSLENPETQANEYFSGHK
jgi:hypothetical protein